MHLTRKQAIKNCLEMWLELSVTGSSNKATAIQEHNIDNNCWFCHYTDQQQEKLKHGGCNTFCPIITMLKFESCHSTAYKLWRWASSNRERKMHAKSFHNQLLPLQK